MSSFYVQTLHMKTEPCQIGVNQNIQAKMEPQKYIAKSTR